MKRLIEAKNDLEMADWLESNLRGCGIDFDENDFPCFRRGFFSEDPPTDIVPFGRRHDFDPMTTALCFYSDDRELYRRIRHLEEDIDAYREFASVMPCDLSVSPLMPIELQRFHLHFNALVNAFLAVNGVKIVAPTRWGSFSNLPLFRCYRESNVFSVGALGTLKTAEQSNEWRLISSRPSVLCIILKSFFRMEKWISTRKRLGAMVERRFANMLITVLAVGVG